MEIVQVLVQFHTMECQEYVKNVQQIVEIVKMELHAIYANQDSFYLAMIALINVPVVLMNLLQIVLIVSLLVKIVILRQNALLVYLDLILMDLSVKILVEMENMHLMVPVLTVVLIAEFVIIILAMNALIIST